MKKVLSKNIGTLLTDNYEVVVVFIMAFFLIVSFLNAKNDSATFDEVAHIPAGYSYLSEHDMRLNPEHPPLIKDLSAIPLLFLDLNFDTSQEFWQKDVNGQWDAGRHLLYKSGNNPDAIIFWSRVPIILLSAALGLFIFKWVREIAGILPGLLALALYSFDPNILGHNHYVTTDIGIAAFLTFSFYYFIRFVKSPTWLNALVGGIFLGLLHLAKFSSIIAFPIFGLILITYPLFRIPPCNLAKNTKKRLQTIGTYLAKGAFAFFVSIVMIWVVYFANTFNMPQENLDKTLNYYFSLEDTNAKNIATNKTITYLNQNDFLRPLGEYGLGLAMVFKRVAGGNGAYFLGEVSSEAFPLYFPTVFLIKETIPFLSLMFLAIIFSTYQIASRVYTGKKDSLKENWKRFVGFVRSGLTQYTLFGFIVLYSYLSVTGNLNIGFRHLFPILPFAYILIAKKVYDFAKSKNEALIRTAKVIFIIFLTWIVVEPVTNYPSYVSYFNQFVGGPANGYKYVTDSNADWGQDIKRLGKWIDRYNLCTTVKSPRACIGSSVPIKSGEPIEKIRVDYFGGGDIFHYIGKDRAILWWDSKRPVEPGWYAISTNFLQGSIHDKTKKDEDSYRWTIEHKPVAQIGTSILIYRIN